MATAENKHQKLSFTISTHHLHVHMTAWTKHKHEKNAIIFGLQQHLLNPMTIYRVYGCHKQTLMKTVAVHKEQSDRQTDRHTFG